MALDIKKDVLLKSVTTFSIGGLCKFYISIRTPQDLKEAFLFIKDSGLSYFILGNGSNVLFDDKGYDGVILHMKDETLTIENNQLEASSGISLPKICKETAKHNLSGFEYLSGIPGSLGGAIFMNAGAEGKTISSYLQKVFYMHEDGREEEFDVNSLSFGYRFSSFKKLKGAIISASFLLIPSFDVQQSLRLFLEKRKKNQPLGTKNAGCIFKNPEGYFAGQLIDKCGLKGVHVGGAKISEKHANFIINEKNGSSQDVLALIALIKDRVKKTFSIDLQEEIIYIPSLKKREKNGL
jgi:UDP-N-acetylmuramate dehydrogenase